VWSAIFIFALVIPSRYRELENEAVTSASSVVVISPKIQVLEGTIANKATLVSTLTDSAIDSELANELAGLVKPVFDTRKFHVGNSYRIEKEMDGELRAFEYKIDDERTLKVSKTGSPDAASPFEARIETLPLETKPQVVDLEIQSSLFGALEQFPKGDLLADRLAGIFAWDVDFNVDIKKGAEIHMVVDEQFHDGSFVKYGPIQAAELINNGKTYRAYRFQDSYYDEKGNAVKRAFLTSPLKVLHITSGFTTLRMHPILGIARAHLAIDYGAPEGTAAFAVANGTVIFAGPNGDLGNFVEIRHTNGLTTGYGHLSGIAPGVVAGRAIKQNDLVGYVGHTGLATGPHLHYMMTRGGKAINPASVKAEPPTPMDAKLKPLYLSSIENYRKMLGADAFTASK